MFPIFLSYGMSADEFWHGDTSSFKAYKKAHELRLSEKNFELWLQGRYNADAVKVGVSYAVWDGRGRKPSPYMDKIPITEDEQKADLEKRKQKTIDYFMKGQIDVGRK